MMETITITAKALIAKFSSPDIDTLDLEGIGIATNWFDTLKNIVDSWSNSEWNEMISQTDPAI